MFDEFHPLLKALLIKLADPEFSIRDVTGERYDWVKAGCPLYDRFDQAKRVFATHAETFDKLAKMNGDDVSRNLSTKESREFWERVDQAAKEIEQWPEWKKSELLKNGGKEFK